MSVTTDGIAELQEAVRSGGTVLPRGAGTKPALSTAPEGVRTLDLAGLSGILEYDPAELTFTALAGTPVAQVVEALAEHDQYMPFDPPLAGAGATLGGTVAAGASGPGAYRHGGVRDFVIGVRLIDGTGRLITGGGKVVKNAAGFDLPKLMVGSMGRLGVIAQLSFKVFPRPQARASLRVDVGSIEQAVAMMAALGRGPSDLDALDFEPPGHLLARIGGPAATLYVRAQRLEAVLGSGVEILEGEDEARLWRVATELEWVPAGATLVKVGLTARRIAGLEVALADTGARARYSMGGNAAWVAWPAERPIRELDRALTSLELAGMVLRGPAGDSLLIGHVRGGAFAARVRSAIDPDGRFPEV